MDLREQLSAIFGTSVAQIDTLGGGCVSSVFRVRLSDGRLLAVKTDDDGQFGLPVEAYMLAYLAHHTSLPGPVVLHQSSRLLVMSFVRGRSSFTRGAQRHAAESLAALHAETSESYGFERDTLIGGLRQPNPPTAVWLEFYRDHRLGYMAEAASDAGRLPPAVRARLERLAAKLDRWLVEPRQPSLIHGDVWTSNVLAEGDQITAFLDPAIYFADPEIELAFTTLFHTFGADFYERYSEIRPIAPGFMEERRHIYNLYPLLVHVRLFGGSYVHAVEQTLTRFGF